MLPEARYRSYADMLRIAAEVGFSETAFLIRAAENTYDVRYFSPRIEVSFCGHATVAAGVARLELRDRGYRFNYVWLDAADVQRTSEAGADGRV